LDKDFTEIVPDAKACNSFDIRVVAADDPAESADSQLSADVVSADRIKRIAIVTVSILTDLDVITLDASAEVVIIRNCRSVKGPEVECKKKLLHISSSFLS
jgi:hypothetical protein